MNKLLKRVFYVIFPMCLIIQFSGCSQKSIVGSASYPNYNETSIIEKSSDVILGEVTKVEKAKKININPNNKENSDDLVTYTVSEIKVIKVIKGNLAVDSTIQVKQLGDKNGEGEETIIKNGGYYKKGQTYVLFLKSFQNTIPGMPYSVLNPLQGQIEIVDNKPKFKSSDSLYTNSRTKDDLIDNISKKAKELQK